MLLNPRSGRLVAVPFVLAAGLFLGKCENSPTTGGDIPVTIERLSGNRLTHIHSNLSWTFNDKVVQIENAGDSNAVENKRQPIPPALVQELLGNQSTPTVIIASWELDEKAGLLRLFDAKADGQAINKKISVTIKPAGQVRVNLGNYQYNVFRNNSKVKK
jgi:hypothetical protein